MPDDFQVVGSLQEVQLQLGNAVPSALAEVLAREMCRQLFDDPVDLASTLVPPARRPVPPPEPIQPVPVELHRFIGDHEAHPGTGKGYAARERRHEDASTAPRSSESMLPLSWSAAGARQGG